MIFAIEGHIQKIIEGKKTQTRRPSDKYKIGKFYAIQPGRGKLGIPDGKILIVAKRWEMKTTNPKSIQTKKIPPFLARNGLKPPRVFLKQKSRISSSVD